MKKDSKEKFKKLQIFAAASLLLVSVLFLFNNPGITGHFSADFKTQAINMEVDKSQMYSLSIDSTEPIYVSSLRMSGEIIGTGSVEIYIENNGQKLLVYKNVAEKEKGLPSVTGMAVAEAAEAKTEEAAVMLLSPLGEIEWKNGLSLSENEEFYEGAFNNKCIDTCFIEMKLSSQDSYKLIFMVEPGTKLKIGKITYTLKDEKL